MAVKQKVTGITEDGGVVVESFMEEPIATIWGDTSTNILPSMESRPPWVGEWVRYQVRDGRRIPMLVTAVNTPDVIDGVIFSGRPSDVGNSYGSRGMQRIRYGDGDGQWAA